MRKRIFCIALAFLIAGATIFSSSRLSFAYEAQVATVKGNNINIRSGPGTDYSTQGQLTLGEQIVVLDEVTGSDGDIWCKISYDNTTKYGYIKKTYVGMSTVYNGLSDSDFENMIAAQKFPESYKPYLRSLHQQYPNWTFTAVHTGLDWETVIKEESVVGRNLVHTNSKSSWKSVADGAYDWDNSTWPGFDSTAWVAASSDIIRYYMDPRNFLDSTYVFQFLDQQFNADVHSPAGLESMLKGTFMESKYSGTYTSSQSGSSSVTKKDNGGAVVGKTFADVYAAIRPGSSDSSSAYSQNTSSSGPGSTPGATPGGMTGGSYVDLIMEAAQLSGVNPYVIASMIIQEQGKEGKSESINGRNSAYPGIYNFYNVEAYESGNMGPVERGLWWASQAGSYDRPWNTVQKAICGGAKFYGENYTYAKQNTFYLKKFNVVGSNLYKHQFMSNIQAAASEGYHLSQAYSSEVKNAAHNFEIPVYKNMPETPSACPSLDGSPNNKLAGLGVEGFALTPSFNKDVQSYDLVVDSSVGSVNVLAAAIDSKASVLGTGTVNLGSGTNKVTISVTAQNGTVRQYTINISRQAGGPMYSSSIGTNVVISGGTSGFSPGGTPSVNTTQQSGNQTSPTATQPGGNAALPASSSPKTGATGILKAPGQ